MTPRDTTRPVVGTALGAWLILAAGTARPAEAGDSQGFIYGKVLTESGSTYEGRLRWGKEEAFWGDHFDSVKQRRPYVDEAPERRGRESFRVFGISIDLPWDEVSDRRSMVARFGDLRRIELLGGDEAILHMKNGSKVEIDGGSNDLGGKIRIWDREIGEIDVRWNRIEEIEFLPTPADLEVADRRLYGTVETRAGDFTGFIQWDKDECLSSDKLDGESKDGEMSIEMGKIRSIERHTRNSSKVVLNSGRELILDDTNDVDSGNRGIFVEDPRFGRVLVDWDAFERIELTRPDSSGPPYADFAPARPRSGSVTCEDGEVHRGRIVYDLDEAETWEILGGDRRDVSYFIPFELIAAVVPEGRDASRITLKNGERLELEDSSDVGDGHDGVLVFGGEEVDPVYLAWDEVRRIDFDH